MYINVALLGITQTYRDALSIAVRAFNARKSAAIERIRARQRAERAGADAECLLDDLASAGVSKAVSAEVLAARLQHHNAAEESYRSAIGEDFPEGW